MFVCVCLREYVSDSGFRKLNSLNTDDRSRQIKEVLIKKLIKSINKM